MNTDQDVALKLAQERAEIVAKYDRGREGAEIEPWEDADYLVYKVTDRFGFLHEEELPYHNAAADRVSVVLCLFVVIDELPQEE